MRFLGIDPGASGGFAMLDGRRVLVMATPASEHETFDELRAWCSGGPTHASLERVHAMPKQGVSSTFKFGMSFGGWRMALAALGIPFDLVSPGVWQRDLGCLSRGDKNVTKRRALELFPRIKVTHAIADALLIAEHGRRRWSGSGVEASRCQS